MVKTLIGVFLLNSFSVASQGCIVSTSTGIVPCVLVRACRTVFAD